MREVTHCPNTKNVYAFAFPQVETTASKRTQPQTAPAAVDVPAVVEGTSIEQPIDSGIHGHNSTTEDARTAFQVLQASVMENAQVNDKETLGMSRSPTPLTSYT